MFNQKSSNETNLEAQIDAVLASMQSPIDKHGPEYTKLVEHLETLYKLKEKEVSPRERINVNTVLTVAGSLLSVGVIVGYERAHVLTSKALSHIVKIGPKI